MGTIKSIRTLKDAGILEDKNAKDTRPDFPRFNLIYGFNGSGKSTLSRILASLQLGKREAGLPEGCTFQIQTTDATIYEAPDKLTGLERRVCVFNGDFIERNLRWSEGKANSIFYISQEQADAAAELKKAESELPALLLKQTAATTRLKDLEKALASYKTQRAKVIAGKLYLVGRKYEAPSLVNDYQDLPFDEKSIVNEETLRSLEEVARRSAPQPTLTLLKFDGKPLSILVASAREYAAATIGEVIIPGAADHPNMVPWLRTGHEYHEKHDLASCLFCGATLTNERKALLAAAFDHKLSIFMRNLETAQQEAQQTVRALSSIAQLPSAEALSAELQNRYATAAQTFLNALPALNSVLTEAIRVLKERQQRPTAQVSTTLPTQDELEALTENVQSGLKAVNEAIQLHNEATADFSKYQTRAREKIRAHFLAEGRKEFEGHKNAAAGAKSDVDAAEKAVSTTQQKIQKLQDQVRTHGPAASHITKLVHAYLGHGELSVVSIKEGYELHRHGRLVKGPPSEGEKTALALCYFLSTLESEGRKVKDLIVVVDDPISSLDTKAMHYACALIRSRLSPAAQLFILTHNLQCMNEFKKDWRRLAYPEDPKQQPPTAAFMFIDVRIPPGKTTRTATLIEMPKYLRAYDSEYHFLCHKVLEFEAKGTEYFEYAYMMPHVIRRVLDVFLAFKIPGSDSLKGKLAALCKQHVGLDPARLVALERLAQGESHSDNLDDLVSQSSMTVEESRDANAALLELMRVVDPNHTAALRKQCAAEL